MAIRAECDAVGGVQRSATGKLTKAPRGAPVVPSKRRTSSVAVAGDIQIAVGTESQASWIVQPGNELIDEGSVVGS